MGLEFYFDLVEYLSVPTGSTFIIKTKDSSSSTFHRSKNTRKYQTHKYIQKYGFLLDVELLKPMRTRASALN